MDRYIVKYLTECATDEWTKRCYDYLKVDIDFRFWSQGNHFAMSWDVIHGSDIASQNRPKWKKILRAMQQYILGIRGIFKSSKPQHKKNLELPSKGYNVLSVVPIPKESIKALHSHEINYVYLNLQQGRIPYEMPAAEAISEYYYSIEHQTFVQLISRENIEQIQYLYTALEEELSHYKFDAVLVRTSELFFEKILIDIFKSHNKPSITLLHGLPGVYTKATEYRAEYLTVWSDIIRNEFIAKGYNPDKVRVAGNCKYSSIPKVNELRCSTDDVLVLTTATFEDHQHEWDYDQFCINDRSLLVNYLYSVEKVLKQNGVKHARLRPHPHVNKEWIKEYLDMDFYSFDYDNILSSLQRATMCVGTTSTTMIEALMSGVTYLVYEPGEGEYSFSGYPLVPPFNKEYTNLKKAYTEEALSELIQSRYVPDANKLLNDFMQPFNAQVIKQILDEQKA